MCYRKLQKQIIKDSCVICYLLNSIYFRRKMVLEFFEKGLIENINRNIKYIIDQYQKINVQKYEYRDKIFLSFVVQVRYKVGSGYLVLFFQF